MNSISIIIPCYKEKVSIRKTVEHTLTVFDNIEIIIADQSYDNNIVYNALEDFIKEGKVTYIESHGHSRAETMNEGAKHAHGSLLVFLHADTLLPYEAREELESLSLNHYPFGAFYKVFSPSDAVLSFNSMYKNRCMKNFGAILGDNAMFIERNVFQVLEGFPSMKLFEDVAFARKWRSYAKENNKKICYINYPVITSGRRFIANGSMKVLLFMGWMHILYYTGTSDARLQNEYRNFGKKPFWDALKVTLVSSLFLLPFIVFFLFLSFLIN